MGFVFVSACLHVCVLVRFYSSVFVCLYFVVCDVCLFVCYCVCVIVFACLWVCGCVFACLRGRCVCVCLCVFL